MQMQKVNYQKKLDAIIEELERSERVPTLLLHSCCAPCSSYVLEYLSEFFSITVLYYNPNIYPEAEFYKREEEERRLISEMPAKHKITLMKAEFDPSEFYEAVKGLEHIKEGGERCFACYRLRLERTAETAKKLGFDYFTTTLSISPLKNSQKINQIAQELAEKHGVKCLPSDFKKKEGYKRSIELSKQYGLYRQDYCGCVFSQNEREKQNMTQKHSKNAVISEFSAI